MSNHQTTTNSVNKVIQWNIRSIRRKKSAIDKLVREHCPIYINLNETMLNEKNAYTLKNYIVLRKDKQILNDNRSYGGVMSLVNAKVNFKELKIKTNLQALAFEITFPFKHTICNVYLDSDQRINEKSLNNLIEQLGHKFILFGDCNGKNRLWGSGKSDRRGKLIENLCEKHSLVILNDNYPTHFDSKRGKFSHLDLTIATSNIAHEFSCKPIDELFGSDHFPIITSYDRFSTSPASSSAKNKININKTDWEKFQNSLKFNKIKVLDINKDCTIETLVSSFNESLVEATRLATPRTSDNLNNKRKQVFWWTNELSEITYLKQFYRHESAKNNEYKESNLREHRRLARIQKIKMDESRKASWESYVESISSFTNSRDAWNKIKAIKGAKSSSKILSVEHQGEVITDAKDIAEAYAEHFFTISQGKENARVRDEVSDEGLLGDDNSAESRDGISNSNSLDDDSSYNVAFTRDELEEVLTELTGTSAGEDEVHNLMLKNLNGEGKSILLSIINRIWAEGRFPEQWRTAVVIPIKKPGSKDDNIANSRGISLISCTEKVMERLANRRLSHVLESKKLISVNQSGFRKYRSTADNLVVLEHNIVKGFNSNQNTIAIFFDLEKAYDKTSRSLIKKELTKKGINGRMQRYLFNFLESR